MKNSLIFVLFLATFSMFFGLPGFLPVLIYALGGAVCTSDISFDSAKFYS
jgi:hypothetical protein